jgi:transcriptional regulator GlxA family with amidase domain
MHRVAVVALDGLVALDFAIPVDTFQHVSLAGGEPGYRVRVCGLTPLVDHSRFQLQAPYGLRELAHADTIVLPGIEDIERPVPEPLIRALQRAAARGARLASICSGAFILAATGLLDGKRATTHWKAAAELARRHPKINVDPDVLYVDEGQILTSAGVVAGLDLCLHIVRRDYGAAVAAEIARASVMPLERDGGQSQFIVHAPPTADGASLSPLLTWLERHQHRTLTLEDIAHQAATSVRSLTRRFREQTGTTPLQWLIRARVRRAQLLLETTTHSIERVASETGFGSASVMREHFRRVVSTTPLAYRRAFAAGAGAARSA